MTFSDNSHFWANFLCRSPNKTMDACSAQKNGCLLFVFRNSFSLFGDLYSGVCRLILYSALGFGWPVDVQWPSRINALHPCFKFIKSHYEDNYNVTHFNISILNKWNFIKPPEKYIMVHDSALHQRNKLHKKIWTKRKSYFKIILIFHPVLVFYCIFVLINSGLVSIRDFLKT